MLSILNSLLILFFLITTPFSLQAKESLIVGGSGADLETFRQLVRAFKQDYPDSTISVLDSIGSGGGVRGAATNRVDIGLISRPLSEKEKAYGLTVIHYANTALVYIVPKTNALENVTLSQLKAIYAGESSSTNLTPILRPEKDSDTLLLKKVFPDLIPSLDKAFQRKGLPTGISDQLTIDLLLTHQNNIATSSLSLIMTEQPAVRVLSLNGVEPSPETIGNGRYPLKKSLSIIHNKLLSNMGRQFIQFIFSNSGKAILERTGHTTTVQK